MVFDVLAGAVLFAFGFFILYFAFESKNDDRTFFAILLLGILLVIVGGWIILVTITLELLLIKIAGLVLALVGLFLLTGFPDVADYQREGMSKAGIIIGLILLIFGVYLFIFY